MSAPRILPAIFIGSSVEGIKLAQAIQSELQHDAECTVWDQDVFRLSSNTLDSLIDFANLVDFAIFVFSPDDITEMRGEAHPAIRDNVLFEFGLFTGILGKRCVFYLKPSNEDIYIPTDLIGVTQGTYPERFDGSLRGAVAPFCTQVREIISQWDVSEQEIASDSIEEYFPGVWQNSWFNGKNKEGDESFVIEDRNKFLVKGEPRFVIENIRINKRKNYIKFTRRGINGSDDRSLSILLRPLDGEKKEGFQIDGKKLVFTRVG